jgi:protein SFI1
VLAAIETLYDIIRRAQTTRHDAHRRTNGTSSSTRTQLASPSSSALFNAYEAILAEQGLQPSDDAILHRFLFRMQEDRRHDEDIFQRFKRVLGELDIHVEVDEEGEGVEVTSNLDKTRDPMRNGAVAALGRHSRRSSFDSFFDGTADKVAGNDYGDLPVRARSGSNVGAPKGYRSQRRVRSDTEAHSYQPQLPIRNKVNGYAHRRSASGQQQPRLKRSVSVSSRGSLQIRREGVTATSRVGDYDADFSDRTDRTTSLDLSHIQVPGINAPIPDISHNSSHQYQEYVPEPFQPSDTRLLDEAEIFEEQRLHRVTRDCIQIWRNRTQERLSIRDDMERLAAAYDRRILLKLGFEQLRDTARVRRSNQETDRFFQRLEERADRARNIFLLTKAFTHWAKSAEDEVQRTSVARRHILRTRFFNGWRDITAVNELKVQHFVLAKFLRQWRSRNAVVADHTEYALELYEANLARRIYKEWFFKFCAIAAPAWRNDRTRKITLHKMSEIAKVLRERQEWAVDRWRRGVLRKTLLHWRGETAKVQELGPRADDFRQDTLVSTALRTLHKQAQLAPLLRQFQEGVNGRVIRKVIQEWRHATQMSQQARNVDRMRILRNAYTAWNDQLRIKALEDRINDRVVVEALYKWTLASRVSLFQRVHDRQLKESAFLNWVTTTNQRANTLDAAERRFVQFKRAQLLRMCLRQMEAITTEKRAEEFAVVADYQQKLKQRIFQKLKERQAHFQQLNDWADAAHFYVLGKSTIKTWSAATQHARRNRRRDTYAQVRRTVKTNLVRRLFANWRNQTSIITHLNQQATDISENRILQSSRALLHQWNDRTSTLRQQDTQANNVYAFKLGTRCLRIWSDRMETLHAMDAQAAALRQESAELAATSALKKLGWRLWNIQRQEENARALYERNFEKHVRAMIRFWAEQMNERLANRPVSPTPTSHSRRSRRDDDNNGGDGGRTPSRDPYNSRAESGVFNNPTSPTQTLFDSPALALNTNHDLDLSLSLTPVHQTTTTNTYRLPPPSSTRPPPSRSILRPTPSRPNTFPQPQSALRPPPPQTIPEDSILDPAFALDLDTNMADPTSFWTGTPMAPISYFPTVSVLGKPGYLKTPSKRSVVRAKRLDLPVLASPEKRMGSVVDLVRERLGAMSAPPAQRNSAGAGGEGGVMSFQKRLREGGFSRSVAPVGLGRRSGRGKARVGFGDVSEMGR